MGPNDLLGQASEARWYCLDRDGVAMLCKDEADALAQVIENDDCWPQRAPHRAALLAAVAAERERPRQVIAYMATSREGTVRFTDNPDGARELESYGWAITPLADAGPNVEFSGVPAGHLNNPPAGGTSAGTQG